MRQVRPTTGVALVIADKWKLDTVLRDAESNGGWAMYAVHVLGDADSGDDELDKAIASLYHANEDVHKRANKLALRYNLDLFAGA